MSGRRQNLFRNLVVILLTAGSAYGFSWLSLVITHQAAQEIGFRTMPGIGLAAVLLAGWPGSLGIFIGTIIFNEVNIHLPAAVSPVTASIAATALAVIVLLESLIGTWLLRRQHNTNNREVRKTLDSAAIMAGTALIGPILGSLAFYSLNLFAGDQIPGLAAYWWLDDLVNIFLFVPAGVLLDQWTRKPGARKSFIWALTCLIIGATLFFFRINFNNRSREISEVLANDSAEMVNVLQDRMREDTQTISSLSVFMSTVDHVTEEQFAAFTSQIQAANSGTLSLSWAPVISQPDRTAFENQSGLTSGFIYETNSSGLAVRAADRAEYFPILYIQPLDSSKNVPGFDLGSNSFILEAINLAVNSGSLTASTPYFSPGDDVRKIELIAPVYKNDPGSTTSEVRRTNLAGIIDATILCDSWIKSTLQGITRHDIELFIFDNETSGFLGYYPSASGAKQPVSQSIKPSELERGVNYTEIIRVGGRKWLIIAKPGASYLDAVNAWSAWMELLAGLMLAVTFLIYTDFNQRKTEEIKAQNEIYQLSSIISQMADTVVITDTNGIIQYVNPAFEKLTGYTKEEALGKTPAILKSGQHDTAFYKRLWNTILSGNVFHSEICNRKKNGEIYYEVKTISPISIGKAEITHFIATGKDITAARHAALVEEAVYRISESVHSANSLHDLYAQIHQQISRIIKTESFYIAIYDQNTDLMEYVYCVDDKDIEISGPFHPTTGLTAHVLRTGKSLLCSPESNDQGIEIVGVPSKFWLGVPLFVHDKCIGVLVVQNYSDPTAFTEREQRILEFVSSQIAIAIDRKQSEDAIRKAELQNKALIENAPDGIVLLDRQGVCLYASPALYRIFGFSPDEIIGQTIRNFMHPDDQYLLLQIREQTIQEPSKLLTVEYRFQRKNGEYLWLESIYNNLFDQPGINALVVNFRDITERKRASELLAESQQQLTSLNRELEKRVEERTAQVRQSEETYRTLFENSNDGIFLLSPFGERINANQKALDLLGLTLEEYKNLPANKTEFLFAPEIGGTSLEKFQALLNGGIVPLYESALTSGDGRTILVEINLSAIRDGSGKIILVQCVVRDITERKKSEAALREHRDQLSQANKALEQASRLKDEFLASMSHELRTPLTGILGLSEALQLQLLGPLSEKQDKAVNNILSSGQHLLELINDILDLSKIEAGKLDMQFENCNLIKICQSSIQLVRGMAQQKNQIVDFHAEKTEICILADTRRLTQILVNLLSNAIKFTPPGGQLGLDVRLDLVNNIVRLRVWDRGIGIKPEDLGKLFEPFVQIDSSLARQYSGTGLGLSLVKRMVELHSGYIQVESEPGVGSQFTINLPYNTEANRQSTPMSSSKSADETITGSNTNKNKLLIMIVDDSPLTLEIFGSFLQSRGYNIQKCSNGFELLEKIGVVKPDLVLLDIQMPGMDGLEVLQKIRAHPNIQIASLPIIAVTALAMAGDREKCLQAGATEYLSKPIPLTLLEDKIKTITGQ